MERQMAEITAIALDKVKVKFNQDDVPSELEYPKLSSYSPVLGDKVLMLKTNTSYICLGGVGSASKESAYVVGEYKFFAKDKGLLWQGWAKCDGREVLKNTYQELFAEIGTTFGIGNGGSTFNLPDATGRVLSDANGKTLGEKAGADSVALKVGQMPEHKHNLKVGTDAHPGGYYTRYAMVASNTNAATTSDAIDETGSGQTHENRQPTLYGGYYYIYTGVM